MKLKTILFLALTLPVTAIAQGSGQTLASTIEVYVFPAAGHPPVPRHPSQLYEALGEGLLLFLLAMALHRRLLPRSGALTALFGFGYSFARILCEQYREPDAHIGFQVFQTTRGQLLTLGILAASLWITVRVWQKKTPSWKTPPEPQPEPTA